MLSVGRTNLNHEMLPKDGCIENKSGTAGKSFLSCANYALVPDFALFSLLKQSSREWE
jgi:hypothetical protein